MPGPSRPQAAKLANLSRPRIRATSTTYSFHDDEPTHCAFRTPVQYIASPSAVLRLSFDHTATTMFMARSEYGASRCRSLVCLAACLVCPVSNSPLQIGVSSMLLFPSIDKTLVASPNPPTAPSPLKAASSRSNTRSRPSSSAARPSAWRRPRASCSASRSA